MRLETERLILREPEQGDRDGYAELYGDPEVVRYLSGTTLPPDEVPAAIDRMLGHWERHGVGLFSVIRKDDEQFVGRVGYLLWDTERWVNGVSEVLEGDLELEIGWTVLRALLEPGLRDRGRDRLPRSRVRRAGTRPRSSR